jgi:hypothetical protein
MGYVMVQGQVGQPLVMIIPARAPQASTKELWEQQHYTNL